MKPLISIIVNCYNGEKYLKEALDSVIEQTYKNWELIFWDNNSNDNSKNIFQNYNESRFFYFKSQKTSTLFQARNEALKKSKGEFISFLDTDDFWDKEKLFKQVEAFNDKSIKFVYSKFWIIEKNKSKLLNTNKFLPSGKITNYLLEDYIIGFSTIMLRKESINTNEPVFNSDFIVAGDFDFIIKMSTTNNFKGIQEALVSYRVHDTNISKLKIEKLIYENKVIYNNFLKDSNISKYKNIRKLKENIDYFEIRNDALSGKKIVSLSKVKNFPLNLRKIKLLAFIFLPNICYKIYKLMFF